MTNDQAEPVVGDAGEAGEAQLLCDMLDAHRRAVRDLLAGLSDAEAAATVGVTTMTIGGIVKHLAYVEHWWLHEVMLGLPPLAPWASVDWHDDPDWDFHSAASDTVADIVALYDSSCEASRDAVAELGGLDARSAATHRDRRFTLRWVLIHMIEETAQHRGHLDLLYENLSPNPH